MFFERRQVAYLYNYERSASQRLTLFASITDGE